MLLFLCNDEHVEVRDEVIVPAGGNDEIILFRNIEEALRKCSRERLLVVDSYELEDSGIPTAQDTSDQVRVPYIPWSAVVNRDSQSPVWPVSAGGGVVVRRDSTGLKVLLIFRRGVWDLPKGKLDDGESPDAGAVREVQEEIGVSELSVEGSLGYTTHGYTLGGNYCVKTTHWYLMTTTESHFTPQADEEIEAVSWVPWEEAKEMLGHRVLKGQLQRAEPFIERLLEQKTN